MHPVLRAAADRRFGVFTAAEAVAAGHGHSEIQNLTALRTLGAAAPRSPDHRRDLERARRDGRAHRVRLPRRPARPRPAPHGGQPRVGRTAAGACPSHGQTAAPVRLTDPDDGDAGTGYVMSRAPLRAGEAWRQRTAAPDVRGAHPGRLRPRVAARGRRRRHGRRAARRPDDARRAAWPRPTAVRHWPGARGRARAAALADGRAESPLETRGGCGSSAPGFPAPELQVEIRTGGRLIARRRRVVRRGGGRRRVRRAGQVHRPVARPLARARAVGREAARGRAPALDIRVVRVADADLGARWTDIETRLGRLLGDPRAVGPAIHRDAARPRHAADRLTRPAGAAPQPPEPLCTAASAVAPRLSARGEPRRSPIGYRSSRHGRRQLSCELCGHAIRAPATRRCGGRSGAPMITLSSPSGGRGQPTPPGVRGRKT